MNTQGLNKSVLALLFASTANGAKAVNTTLITNTNHFSSVNSTFLKSYYYALSLPARYKHEIHGYIEGQILLNITDTKITPPYLNKVAAEYEGEFYFISNQIVDDNKIFESLGGEKGKIILDMVNKPNKENSESPTTYNMHSCSSTLSTCFPLAIQMNVYQNGNIKISGTLSDSVEILYNKKWTHFITDVLLLPMPSE